MQTHIPSISKNLQTDITNIKKEGGVYDLHQVFLLVLGVGVGGVISDSIK